MFRKSRFTAIFVLAAFLVVTVAGVAFAGPNILGGADRGIIFQDFIAKLATNLGVDQNTLNAAMETTKMQMLDEAVQKGNLTREQADKIAARKMENLDWPGGFHGKRQAFGGRNGKFGHMGGIAAENILGISSEQLREELQSGKSWEQIITESGLTMEQFSQKMLENKKEAIAKAVTDGKMTQEQADRMLGACPLTY